MQNISSSFQEDENFKFEMKLNARNLVADEHFCSMLIALAAFTLFLLELLLKFWIFPRTKENSQKEMPVKQVNFN